MLNKKVLLRERKRHTSCCVASTPYVVLTGYPPHPDLAGGGTLNRYPPAGNPPLGTPLAGYPLPGYPCQGTPLWQGTPPAGYPSGRVPPWQGTPLAGYPPWQGTPLAGYPPSCPMAFWVMLQSIMGYGYPPQVWTD